MHTNIHKQCGVYLEARFHEGPETARFEPGSAGSQSAALPSELPCFGLVPQHVNYIKIWWKCYTTKCFEINPLKCVI